jgi:HK97 gp10 family phage protein
MPKLEIKGLGKLEKQLKENVTMDDVKKVVRHNGAKLMVGIVKKADFAKGYQIGTTKRSITLEIKHGGFTAEVEPGTEYSPYLEYGTRYMEAQPFVKPAFDVQAKQFQRDMDKLVR